MQRIAGFVLILSLALFACSKPAPPAVQPSNTVAAPLQFTHNDTGGGAPPTLAPMLAIVSPAVVSISVQGTVQRIDNPLLQDPFFKRFFGFPDSSKPDDAPPNRFQSVGSGVIYDAHQGYVITNKHVVDRADKILVTLSDRRQLEAKLVAADAQTDIAVLKVTFDKLSALPIGNSKDLAVGDYVVAVGNPFGVGQTATFGIVSALGRSGLGIEGYEDFIQTDAAVNPGNSGGALVDMAGRLVGINTAILSRSGGNVGIGFAIPIDMVKSVAGQLIEHGRVSRGELGVTIQDLTPALAQAMGLKISTGALVSQVRPGSAAARAGIREGDVIIALNGETLTGSAQLRNQLGQMQPGTIIRLLLTREGKDLTVTATLGALTTIAEDVPSNHQPHATSLGLTVAPIPTSDPDYAKLKGVYVSAVEPGSSASDAGIKQGDIIVSVGHVVVTNPHDFAQIVGARQKGVPLLLQIRRGNFIYFVALA